MGASQAYSCGHIVLYHGVFRSIPSGLESRLHNVQPGEFKRQINWIRDNFTIVSIDDFVNDKDRRGLACITFDDAYADIFDFALPWLLSENIASTIYLNSSLVGGNVFWRDKVRLILSHGLENAFLNYANDMPWQPLIRSEKFYKDSKKPEVDSRQFDQTLDGFFQQQGLEENLKSLSNVIVTEEGLIDDPLISYGNHAHSHYVLSSLSSARQEDEIQQTDQWLDTLSLNATRSFAAPFGGSRDVNDETFSALDKVKSSALLMSRKRVNRESRIHSDTDTPILERYMAPSTLEELIPLVDELEA